MEMQIIKGRKNTRNVSSLGIYKIILLLFKCKIVNYKMTIKSKNNNNYNVEFVLRIESNV